MDTISEFEDSHLVQNEAGSTEAAAKTLDDDSIQVDRSKFEFQATVDSHESEESDGCEDIFEDAEIASFLEELSASSTDGYLDFDQAHEVPSLDEAHDGMNVAESLPSQEANGTDETPNLQPQITNSIDTLIQRQRTELALELRRLRFTNHLVTPRQNLERFFTSNQEPTSRNVPGATTQQDATVQAAGPITYRSDTVQSELDQLNGERRVEQVLQTQRANLERVLNSQLDRRANATPSNGRPQAPTPNRAARSNDEIRVGYQAAEAQNAPLFAAIQEHSRNQVLSELGELIHRQMVSNTLESEFRRTLELRIVDRLRRFGNNEQANIAMQQLARPLPTRARANSNSSEQAPRTSYRNQSREISELKTEISELKSLLKLSFELQLDMQRSFKQEISALVNNTFGKADSNRLVKMGTVVNDKDGVCVICAESKIDTVFYQCGHMCACYKCSMQLMQQGLNCAVCRAPIKDIVRTYRCNFGETEEQ